MCDIKTLTWDHKGRETSWFCREHNVYYDDPKYRFVCPVGRILSDCTCKARDNYRSLQETQVWLREEGFADTPVPSLELPPAPTTLTVPTWASRLLGTVRGVFRALHGGK